MKTLESDAFFQSKPHNKV